HVSKLGGHTRPIRLLQLTGHDAQLLAPAGKSTTDSTEPLACLCELACKLHADKTTTLNELTLCSVQRRRHPLGNIRLECTLLSRHSTRLCRGSRYRRRRGTLSRGGDGLNGSRAHGIRWLRWDRCFEMLGHVCPERRNVISRNPVSCCCCGKVSHIGLLPSDQSQRVHRVHPMLRSEVFDYLCVSNLSAVTCGQFADIRHGRGRRHYRRRRRDFSRTRSLRRSESLGFLRSFLRSLPSGHRSTDATNDGSCAATDTCTGRCLLCNITNRLAFNGRRPTTL